MKYIYRVLVFSILFSCENKSIFEKETSTVNSFPQTITLKGEEQKLEALGIVDIMVIDTFLIAYTPMNHDYYYLVYSTAEVYCRRLIDGDKGAAHPFHNFIRPVS